MPERSTDADDFIKVSMNLPRQIVAAVEELAHRRGTTKTEVVRRAISTEKFLQDQIDRKAKILIEDSDDRVRELIFQ